MIKMDKLIDAIKYSLWSGYVEGSKPISLLIISKPECGKTTAIEKFKENQGVVYFNDVTPWGLVKELHKFQDLGKPINHVLIPDFLNIISKSQTSTKAMIQFFNSCIEEGLSKIQTYGINIDVPTIQFGLITAITINAFKTRKRSWENIGFVSRMLPFSYKYSLQGAQEIIKSIFNELESTNEKQKITFPKEKQVIMLSPEIAEKMFPYAQRLASAEKLYGFRHQKQLQTLIKAIALSKGRNVVDDEDLQELMKIAEFFNLEFNEIDLA